MDSQKINYFRLDGMCYINSNGAIVSTSLKEGASKKGEVNIKTWKQRISKEKVKNFIDEIRI